MKKICWQITVAAFMQPLQYDLRNPAAKDKSITNAATARSNLDATIYTAGTILQLQSTMEFHRQLIHQQHLQYPHPLGQLFFFWGGVKKCKLQTNRGTPPSKNVSYIFATP